METVKLYTLAYSQPKTYVTAAVFVAGNIALPQLFHLLPQGGAVWLPIYFFTLIAAYKYGWKAGLLTAVTSPLVNAALFGMPAVAMLPVILAKSALLAAAAAFAAKRFRRVAIPVLIGVVLAYQAAGTLFEWLWTGSLFAALQDFRIAFAGMLLQVFGGYAVLKYAVKNG